MFNVLVDHSAMEVAQHLDRDTVQAFNFCTSRPDVCRCLVVRQSWVRSPGCTNTHGLHVKEETNHNNDSHSLRIKVTFSCDVIIASMARKLLAIGSAVAYYAQPGPSTHLVQELNVGTVPLSHGGAQLLDRHTARPLRRPSIQIEIPLGHWGR